MDIASLRETLSDLRDEAESLQDEASSLDSLAEDASNAIGNLEYEIQNAISSASSEAESFTDQIQEVQGTAERIQRTIREVLESLDSVEVPAPAEETGQQLLARAIAKIVAEALEAAAQPVEVLDGPEAVEEAVETDTPTDYGYVS